MAENINNMKNNDTNFDDIMHKIRHSQIEDFLEFDDNGKYKFLKCETCSGPILCHIEVTKD